MRIDEQYVVDLLRRLVQTDSVNPYHDSRDASEANEQALAELLEAELEGVGLACRKEYAAPYRPVVISECGGDAGPVLMLNAHMDTVGIAGMTDPFSGRIAEGRLHGRGAADTKASIAAMVAAMRALVDGEGELAGRCVFTAVCDEENEGIGTQYIAANGPRADAAIVGEPTGLAVGIGQVGGFKFKIVCEGEAAHGNVPDAGISAILSAARLALRLDSVAAKRSHPLLGRPGFNIGRISGGVDATTVPAHCEFDCDRRVMPGEAFEQIVADIEELLDQMRAADPTFKARIEPSHLGPVAGFELPPEEPVVQTLCRACHAVLDAEPAQIITPYGGDGMYLHRVGMPAITFGPGDIRDAHAAEESVEVTQVIAAAQIIARAVVEYCGRAR